jgi:hypothetical protein
MWLALVAMWLHITAEWYQWVITLSFGPVAFTIWWRVSLFVRTQFIHPRRRPWQAPAQDEPV